MKKLTEYQQIQQWIRDDSVLDNSESTISDIFTITMKYMERYPEMTLIQAYAYAYVTYMNKTFTKNIGK